MKLTSILPGLRAQLSAALIGLGLALSAQAANQAANQTAKQVTHAAASINVAATAWTKSQQLFRLDEGHWLSLEKNGLRLNDAHGQTLAQFKLRAKQLDLRQQQGLWLALSMDADTQQAVVLQIDLAKPALRELQRLPAPPFSLEAQCWYRDQQGLLQAFLIGKEGISQQWLLQPEQQHSQLLRQLAVPPQTEQCLADDQSGSLLILEQTGRLWRYRADAEGPLQASLLGQLPEQGKHSAHMLSLAAGQVLVSQPQANYLWQAQRSQHLQRLKSAINSAARGAQTDSQLSVALPARAGQLNWLQRRHQPDGSSQWHTAQHKVELMPAPASSLPYAIVEPMVQTASMQQYGDSADDPAIWQHPVDGRLSRVLGTNKKFGLLVYDMQGRQTQALASGRLNNVDVRQNLRFTGSEQRFDLAMASQRDDNSLVLYQINPQGEVAELTRFATPLDKIYGFCLYQPLSGGLHAIVNDKDGRFLQYQISYRDTKFSAELAREFATASQPEACVADDKRGLLFIGEEKRGVWVLPADAHAQATMQLILPVGQDLVADTEGLALYHGQHASYLVVSSQGDHSYLVLEAQAPYRLRGKFRIGMNPALGIDGTSETDGIELSSANFGGVFSQGMLVVQDGYKRLPDGPQNFKYVPWSAIRDALRLP